MALAIRMPDLGTTVEEITLRAWLVKEGDAVKRGDEIAEIETDKATSALECAADGVLLKVMMPAGAVAVKGDILAYVGQPGEVIPVTEAPVAAPPPEVTSVPRREDSARIAPMVRNLARTLGVDLDRIRGTGAQGAITRADVLAASRAPSAAAPGDEGDALPRSQAAVAKAVLASTRDIPHLRIAAAFDMSAVDRIRRDRTQSGRKISYDAFFLKALADAVAETPLMAARLVGARVVRSSGMHIAVAIGVENALFLPVIRDVDRKSLAQVQSDIESVAAQVRSGRLAPEHATGGCMTLSNLGMYPIESFDAIIFPEHSAILAVGAAQKKPTVVEDRVEIRPVALATLAADHRLINGRTAARFLSRVKEIIESGAFA